MELLHGDCLQLMKEIPDNSVDLVLTDPPYGIDYQSARKPKECRFAKIKNDKKPFVEFIPEIKRILKPTAAVMIFTKWTVQQSFIDEMTKNKISPQNVIIWDKVIHGMGDLNKAFGNRYESILYHAEGCFSFKGKRPTDIIRCKRVSSNKMIHPNEKPILLLEYLIECCTNKMGVVLDCFMGSGSTGVACVNTGRDFIGMELDDKYYDIACKRIAQAQEDKAAEDAQVRFVM